MTYRSSGSKGRYLFLVQKVSQTRMPFCRRPTSHLLIESQTLTISPWNDLDLGVTLTSFMTSTSDKFNQIKLISRCKISIFHDMTLTLTQRPLRKHYLYRIGRGGKDCRLNRAYIATLRISPGRRYFGSLLMCQCKQFRPGLRLPPYIFINGGHCKLKNIRHTKIILKKTE